jgi:hypothetical protein
MRNAGVTVERPTILIGIGGTGCLIAERVLAKAVAAGLPSDSRALVVGIDTHVRDLRALHHIEKRFRIQISDQRSVRELLMGSNWESVKNWHLPAAAFSEDTLSKSLISGAGQIRMLSRLATHGAMRDGSIEQILKEAITRVTRLKNDDRHSGEIQIVITASLAGATGSGSFIQIASIMDQTCRAAGVTGLVRGVFLLGDVFVRTSTLPIDQVINARFNTYAALAELNACNAYASGRGVPVGFDFEVAPGMRLPKGVPPLQTVTLIDFENDIGGNLGSDLDAYHEMAVRAVHQYAFTPIGERLDAVMVNDVRAHQRAEELGRRPLYSGIGVHTILYPRDAVEDYVTLAYAAETLRGEWLILDDLFDIAFRDYEMRRQTDPGVQRPDVGDLFLRNFELLRGESAFIRQIHAALHPGSVDLDGNLPPPIHTLYLEALRNEVLRQYWELPPLPTTVGGLVPYTIGDLEDDDDLPRTVQDIETRLDRAWRSVQTTAASLPSDIFRTVFSAGLEPERLGGYRPHHLKKWLVLDRQHLVAVRWFLYSLRRDVRAARERLDAREIQTALEALGRQFDPPRRRRASTAADRDETAPRGRSNPEIHARAEAVRGKGVLGLFRGRRRSFVAQLVAYHQNSLALIRKWAVTRVEEQVYDGLLREIDALVALVEMSFDRVKVLKREIDGTLAEIAGAHSSARGKGIFDGIRYVYAEPEDKRRVARGAIESDVRSDADGAEVNGAIGELIFATYVAARRERPADPGEAIVRTDVAALGAALRTRLIDQDARRVVRARLRPHYDFSVWRAVQLDWQARREEAELAGAPATAVAATAEAHLAHLVEEVRSHAQPFIDYATVGVGQSIIYWSINPRVVAEFGDRTGLFEILKSEEGENPDENDVYGTNELLCTHVRANLDLSDLKKLHPGEATGHARGVATGVYRKAYLDEVAPLRSPAVVLGQTSGRITPHIDRNWHKAGVLPELFSDMQKQIDVEIDRSIVVALVLDLLITETQVGRGPITSIDLSKLPDGAGAIVEIVGSADDWTIVRQLRRNSDYGLAAEVLWDAALARMDVANARLLKSDEFTGLVERILALAIPDDGEEEQRRRVAESLLTRLFEILTQVVQRLMPQQTAPARIAYARQLARPCSLAAIERLSEHHRLAPEQVRGLGLIVERVASATAATAGPVDS